MAPPVYFLACEQTLLIQDIIITSDMKAIILSHKDGHLVQYKVTKSRNWQDTYEILHSGRHSLWRLSREILSGRIATYSQGFV